MELKKLLCLFIVTPLLVPITELRAQSLEESLQRMLGENARGYVQPLVTGFGAGMNSGLYRKASTATATLPLPIGIDVGLLVTASAVPESGMKFEYSMMENEIVFPLSQISLPAGIPASLRPDDVTLTFEDIYNNYGVNETPTIASDEDGVVLETRTANEVYTALKNQLVTGQGMNANDVDTYLQPYLLSFLNSNLTTIAPTFPFPDGLGLAYVPTASIQANVRIPFGIELQARYVPEYEISEEFGMFTMYGAGLRKSLPVPIVNVSVGAFYQVMKVGSIMEATNINYHVEVGRRLPIPIIKITPYIGAGYDQTTINLSYT
ncbi:MAG TPA: hypothetical protein ENO01_00250, partial [Candidatus Marinimicrobia bacterium]|nr:hypothetical protein [Candidatus Neomarinimicrobiota bacterium]